MNDVTITTGASRVLEDLKAWGIKATSIWTHFDDSANEWWSFFGTAFLPLGSPASAGLFIPASSLETDGYFAFSPWPQ
jgi:hypothetical protein